MFNLEIGKAAQTAQMFTPTHPDPSIGTGHKVSFMLFGKHSPQYRDAVAALMREQKEDETQEDRAKASAKFVATCCLSYTDAKGVKSTDMAELEKTLGSEDYRWMRVQADNFMSRDNSFFGKPSKK